MAGFTKSDDSGDSDYSPCKDRRKRLKAAALSRKKKTAGASKLTGPPPASRDPTNVNASRTDALPTPDLTPTDPTFAAQFAAYEKLLLHPEATQWAPLRPASSTAPEQASQVPPSGVRTACEPEPATTKMPTFQLNGTLRFEDEVLDALLRFSRRGPRGHCSRDTADIWIYVLRLFFPAEEDYEITVSNYAEQAGTDFPCGPATTSSEGGEDADEIPSGTAVTVQLWKLSGRLDAAYGAWTITSQTPVLTVVCAACEAVFAEYPAVRHARDGSASTMDVLASTPLQTCLHAQLGALLRQHEESVAQGRNMAPRVKSVNGAVACGTMVRFYKLKTGNEGSGWLRAWSARGLDLVNGVPSEALGCVERILLRIKRAGRKGMTAKM
ncbi:uncharacterized protein PV09_08303 [Verruconis gallopava]|uniref:Uncharacterized protein n=1 Tax=Verruconis gallopava TaxID=253628 RepID=A0A0D1XD18_9PEZI|nr:uncharacterized protein PV09_08303 [Verruconis gallopava]KIW00121.1 hypothetical protein PV09_08303 [Verruconis gallopava]